MAQTKPKAGQFYGVSNNGTDGEFLQTDGTGGMAWALPITNPTITSIDYPGSATAANPAGGESVIINGTLFASGITCTVGGTSAVTAFNSANQITITTPAKAAGQYTVAVTNSDGGTVSQANFIQYSGVPVWSTAAGNIGSVQSGSTASFQVTATEGSDTIEYAVTTGTLPTGLSLATATGAITGTAGSVAASTTTTFSITATDDENQTSSERSFNITVTPDLPSNYFNTVLYTGNGGTQSITGNGFKPDFIWGKTRGAAQGGFIVDSVRGRNNSLLPYSNSADNPNSSATNDLISFDSNGFTVGPVQQTFLNSGYNQVAWLLKAGGKPTATNSGSAGGAPTSGSVMINGVASTAALAGNVVAKKMSVNTSLEFSIVDFTSVAGSTNQVPHGLSGTPDLFIFKRTDAAQDWYVYTEVIDGSLDYLVLNSNAAKSDSSETAPTATTVYQPTSTGSRDYILYSFKSKPGFSKIGTYTGTGASGNLVQTGFEPAFVIIKAVNSGDNWYMLDNKRLNGSFPFTNVLYPNLTNSEQANVGGNGEYSMNFLTNGFELTEITAGYNQNNGTFLYIAFAADPSTTTPSLANSFATELYTGNGGTQSITTGFKPDWVWLKERSGTQWHGLYDSIRGVGNRIVSNSSNAENFYAPRLTSFNSNGFSIGSDGDTNTLNDTYVSWNWKAGGLASINTGGTIPSVVSANQAAGFSIVKCTSPSSTINFNYEHGLSTAPELVMVKTIETASYWEVIYPNNFSSPASSSPSDWNRIKLNEADAKMSSNAYLAADSTKIYNGAWGANTALINYCFTSISGYQKIGSYTANGSTTGPIINTGFEPRFLLIKSADNSYTNWMIFDKTRTPNNPMENDLKADSPAAEQTGTGNNYPQATTSGTGFQVNTTDGAVNGSGTYIYLAIA